MPARATDRTLPPPPASFESQPRVSIPPQPPEKRNSPQQHPAARSSQHGSQPAGSPALAHAGDHGACLRSNSGSFSPVGASEGSDGTATGLPAPLAQEQPPQGCLPQGNLAALVTSRGCGRERSTWAGDIWAAGEAGRGEPAASAPVTAGREPAPENGITDLVPHRICFSFPGLGGTLGGSLGGTVPPPLWPCSLARSRPGSGPCPCACPQSREADGVRVQVCVWPRSRPGSRHGRASGERTRADPPRGWVVPGTSGISPGWGQRFPARGGGSARALSPSRPAASS